MNGIGMDVKDNCKAERQPAVYELMCAQLNSNARRNLELSRQVQEQLYGMCILPNEGCDGISPGPVSVGEIIQEALKQLEESNHVLAAIREGIKDSLGEMTLLYRG